jgi:hypothetical protein
MKKFIIPTLLSLAISSPLLAEEVKTKSADKPDYQQMLKMRDSQIKNMQAHMQKMREAKTPEERQKLIEEYNKSMHDHVHQIMPKMMSPKNNPMLQPPMNYGKKYQEDMKKRAEHFQEMQKQMQQKNMQHAQNPMKMQKMMQSQMARNNPYAASTKEIDAERNKYQERMVLMMQKLAKANNAKSYKIIMQEQHQAVKEHSENIRKLNKKIYEQGRKMMMKRIEKQRAAMEKRISDLEKKLTNRNQPPVEVVKPSAPKAEVIPAK